MFNISSLETAVVHVLTMFVISPFFSTQEGAGHQVLSAFVEIVFDNSDNRMPVMC